jgi:hypothetical protein
MVMIETLRIAPPRMSTDCLSFWILDTVTYTEALLAHCQWCAITESKPVEHNISYRGPVILLPLVISILARQLVR